MTSFLSGDTIDLEGDDVCNGPIAALLGAGASVDAGLPTSKQLVELIRARLGTSWRRGFDAAGGSPGGEGTIEDVFLRIAAHHGRESVLAHTVLGHLKELLRPREDGAASYLAQLVLIGGPTRLSTFQPVFTLNYDTLFEDECRATLTSHWEAEWRQTTIPLRDFVQSRVVTGFSDVDEGYGVLPYDFRGDLERTMDFWRRDVQSWSHIPTVHIHKLHGSLDWFRCYDQQGRSSRPIQTIETNPAELHPAEYAELSTRTSQFQESARNVVVCRRLSRRVAFSDDVTKYASCFVFATTNKLTTTYPFFFLLSRFEKLVRSVWLLVVVGYSFGDAYLNQLIRARIEGAFRSQRGGNHMRSKTVVVAPSAWKCDRGDLETLDGANAESRHRAAVYCNSSARAFTRQYRELVCRWFREHVSTERPWSELADDERFLTIRGSESRP